MITNNFRFADFPAWNRRIMSAIALCAATLPGANYHISQASGNDTNPGTREQPFETIDTGARIAEPGDSIIVHEGVYRECVRPARSGTDEQPIVYTVAAGERVEIKGSERISNWQPQSSNVWKASFEQDFFGEYNPYTERMAKGPLPGASRKRSLGEVYLNGSPLDEVDTPEDVPNKEMTWAPSGNGLEIYANFGGTDPNIDTTEIHVREQVIAPDTWNLGHITISGFIIEHSANNYDDYFGKAGSLPQKGAISTRGGHDWTIENCHIRLVKSVAVDYGLQCGDTISKYGNPERFGYHTIRNNVIRDAGVTGLIGYRAPFVNIEGNAVINCNRLNAAGLGKAGIKCISRNVDVVIKGNYFYNNTIGDYHCIWMDWSYQGARLSGNVFVNNDPVWFEAGHGPCLVDNNVFVNTRAKFSDGGGVGLVHNLFYKCDTPEFHKYSLRSPQYFEPHTQNKLDDAEAHVRDIRFFSNVFVRDGGRLPPIRNWAYDNTSDYNAYFDGAQPVDGEDAHSLVSNAQFEISVEADADSAVLVIETDSTLRDFHTPFADSTLVGQLNRYVPQSTPTVDRDFFDNPRDSLHGIAGPFTNVSAGTNRFLLFKSPPEPQTPSTSSKRSELRIRPKNQRPRSTPYLRDIITLKGRKIGTVLPGESPRQALRRIPSLGHSLFIISGRSGDTIVLPAAKPSAELKISDL